MILENSIERPIGAVKKYKSFLHSPFSASFIDLDNCKNNTKLFSTLSSRAELPVDMNAEVSGSIETLSREISRHSVACLILA